MPSLPSVFVELRANAAQFQSAMQSAQGELKKTADTATSASDRMANVGKIAFAGLAASATAFGAVAVKAALDGEKAHAQLVQAVTNSGVAFSDVSGKVDDMSSKFAKLGFENDEVEAALTRLVQSSGSTTQSLQEMGLAADLARGHSMSLVDASTALGKIMAGNMKGMTAFGLSTKDAAGNTLTAAQAIAELNDRFGGAAAANADTYAGQLQKLDAEFKNATEAIGNMLVPALATMAGAVADGVGWLDQHREVAGALAGVVGGPLVAAITLYAARQAQAFAESVAGAVGNVAKAIYAIVPAAEAAEAAETGLAATTAVATGGLSLIGAAVGIVAMKWLGHSQNTDAAAASMGNASQAADSLGLSEASMGGAVDAATAKLKAQADLYNQLNGDTSAMSGEILKLIGDQQSLDQATTKLAVTTKNNTQAQKDAKTAVDNLASAQDKLNKATDTYNKLEGGLGADIARNQEEAHHNLEQAQLNVEQSQTKVNEAVAEFGRDSPEARQAILDQESAYFALADAQDAMGNVGQDAWDKVNDAQQAVVDAKQGVQDAIDNQRAAIDKMVQPTSDVAANTLAWQQAQHTLNDDFGVFKGMLNDHPEIAGQFATEIANMKNSLPKGADTKPLMDLLDKMTTYASSLNQTVKPGSMLDSIMKGQGALPAGAPAAVMVAPPTAAVMSPTGMSPSTLDVLSGRRAAGGPTLPGGTYLVGENGPELLRMGSSAGTVSPMGGDVQIIINGYAKDPQELAVIIRDELLKSGRNLAGVGLS